MHNFHQNLHLTHHGSEKSRLYIDFYWFLLIFIDFPLIFIHFHWFSLIFHPKTLQNYSKSLIWAKSCKMMKKLHNFHQNRQVIHYGCEKNDFTLIFIDFSWFSLIFHWFSLIFIDFQCKSIQISEGQRQSMKINEKR